MVLKVIEKQAVRRHSRIFFYVWPLPVTWNKNLSSLLWPLERSPKLIVNILLILIILLFGNLNLALALTGNKLLHQNIQMKNQMLFFNVFLGCLVYVCIPVLFGKPCCISTFNGLLQLAHLLATSKNK